MKLAVCLTSCGRHDLTERAVDSFLEHNGLGVAPMALLQADEPSMGTASALAGARGGFLQVHAPPERAGLMEALRAHVAAAQALSCTHMLWLENDWLTCGPLPWEVFPHFPMTRLFGAWKRLDRGHPRARAGEHFLGTKARLHWLPSAFEGWEEGCAHWAAGGSIIETALLAQYAGAARVKDLQMAMGPRLTARPAVNIMHSVGDETTPGFVH